MPNDTFLKLCKDIVVKYFNENVDKTDNNSIRNGCAHKSFIVLQCFTRPHDEYVIFGNRMYYEITHNGDKNETYVDAYKKWENFVIK